ncbi:dephospho-CoA kinase [Corynebacterium ulceribovis]|uniref:dephospho-CoA kinase n=1 Tax=Corynebacterium ulceribovis TaxID=487732 RepID=UPI00037D0AC4|nr:dephospho-CoA kinase [Corynebacterium ulceribovis]
MLLIGLTGGIGSGKSTVARLLADHGLPIVDADQIARDIVEPGQPALAELVDVFGPEVLLDSGALNRAELAARAFATPEATAKLNAITHPRIQAETTKKFAQAQLAGHKAVVYDMPLLIDNGLHLGMSLTVVVHADVNKRIERLKTYRNMPEADARSRIAAQIDDATRLAAADVVIDNNGAEAELAPQVAALIAKIDELAAEKQGD